MFGSKKKEKAPEDPRIALLKEMTPKKHRGYDTNFKDVVANIPNSSSILAVLPSNGFRADCWVLTDKAVHLWSPFTQMVIPLNSNVVAVKNIGSLEIGSTSAETVNISAHPGNVTNFYQRLMGVL